MQSEMETLDQNKQRHRRAKRWFWAASVAALLFSVVMLLCFPREDNAALATVFAILFWLSLTACIVFAVLTIRSRGKPGRSKPTKQNKTIDS